MLRDKIRDQLNQLSLKTQLTFLITITVSTIIIIIITFNYHRNTDTIMSQQISTSTTLLNLETQNIDTYLSEVDRYSLLFRNDEKTLQNLTTTKPLSYQDITNIQTKLKNNFYSRYDLISYRLYMLNQSENYEITAKEQMVKVFYNDSIKVLPEYEQFTKGKYYKMIKPTKEKESFIQYYRTIINIEDQKPIAVVELVFDTSFMDALAENHSSANEIFCMIDSQGRMLYSNNDEIITTQALERLSGQMKEESHNNFITEINQAKYLTVYNISTKHDYSIMILNSLDLIDYQVTETRNISLVLGMVSISIAAVLAITFIGLVTTPLSKLSHRLRKVGKGNFTTTTDIRGSVEIAHLAESFNNMIYQIDELITKNYIAELNEKTGRLIALEAQINPHFLYNTLQAISAEAIVNNQPQINDMIISLAAMLRYSIKGGDFVMLKDEMKHVRDYLLLQHARFDEALTYDITINPRTQDLLIPKMSIQILVENAILHGMSGDITSIHIQINNDLVDDTLIITVMDNGFGISEEQYAKILDSFTRDFSAKVVDSGIGLSNLYSRLRILYGEKAKLSIDSSQNKETVISLFIPIVKEEDNV